MTKREDSDSSVAPENELVLGGFCIHAPRKPKVFKVGLFPQIFLFYLSFFTPRKENLVSSFKPVPQDALCRHRKKGEGNGRSIPLKFLNQTPSLLADVRGPNYPHPLSARHLPMFA